MSNEAQRRYTDSYQWLNERTPEQVEDDIKDVPDWKLFTLDAVADDSEMISIIDEEVERRENEKDEDSKGFTVYYGANQQQQETQEAEVWDSGLEVVDGFGDLADHLIGAKSVEQYAKNELGIEKNKVIVPEKVRRVCVAIQRECGGTGGSEWGALFKGEWTDEGFVVKPDYIIPEQNASRAHINYEEDLKKYRDEGYVVNIHSHPFSGENAGFSGTDDDHINSNFDVALLYGGKAETIVNGIANLELDDGVKLQINPEIQVGTLDLPDVDTDGIEIRNRGGNSDDSGSGSSFRTGHGHGYYGYNQAKGTQTQLSSSRGTQSRSEEDNEEVKASTDREWL